MNPTDEAKLDESDAWAAERPEEAAAETAAFDREVDEPVDYRLAERTEGNPYTAGTEAYGFEEKHLRLQQRIREAKELVGHPESDEHNGGFFDSDLGLVCACGEMLGGFEPREPVESVTTQAASAAEPATALAPPANLVSAVSPQDPILAMMDIVDPTQPYTPEEVEMHILDAVGRLESGVHFERLCIEEVYQLELAWTLEEARLMAKAQQEGHPSDMRKKRAVTEGAELYARYRNAKMKLDAVQTTMHSLRSVISGYQTVSRSVTETYKAATGQSPRRP